MIIPVDSDALEALRRHATAFAQSGLGSYTGYFPNNSYGKEGERYYKWAKQAYNLIKALEPKKSGDN